MCSAELDGLTATLGDAAVALQCLGVMGDTTDELAVIRGICHAHINAGLDTADVDNTAIAAINHDIAAARCRGSSNHRLRDVSGSDQCAVI